MRVKAEARQWYNLFLDRRDTFLDVFNRAVDELPHHVVP